MARLVTCLLLITFLLPRVSQARQTVRDGDTLRVDLSAALQRSLDVSPEVDATEAKRAFADARLSLARASRFLTEFTATTAHAVAPAIDNPNNTPSDRLYLDPEVRNDWDDLSPFNRIEFEAIQPLWTWGELGSSIDAAQAGVAVDAAGVRMTEDEVLTRTAELYYGLQLADALGRLTREAGDIVEQAKEEIDRLLEEGASDVDYADLFQVEITEQEFFQRKIEVEESRALARSALSRQLFLPEGQRIDVTQSFLEAIELEIAGLEEWQSRALNERPDLDQVQAGIQARESLVDAARSDYYPKFFLGLSGKWAYAAGRERQRNPYVSDPFLSRGVQAGLALRQNLNFSQTRAKVRQAEAEHAEVRAQGDALRQLVLFEVEQAWRRVTITRAAMEAREEALLISKRWLRDEQINFDLDLGDTENLVRAVRDNLSLQAQREQAVHDYNVAVIRLLRKTGQLKAYLENGTLLGL
ncbi:MAG: TolC family protein [Bacteroidota bacterium]|nr:TolC family protein [Bacteroidota bacterium]